MDTDTRPALRLKVESRNEVARDMFMFDLRDEEGRDLPEFEPGSHVVVTAPNGQKRRYSLCNSVAERKRYVIVVKREENGRGGSLSITSDLREGDSIDVEPPANDFPMSTTTPRSYIFIAGGIGITPVRAMALHIAAQGKTNWKLYYFTRSPEITAFREELADPAFAGNVVIHHDNGAPDEAYDLWPVLEEPSGAHLYCCGPKGLMDAVRDMSGHWPDNTVHFEDFVGAEATRADDTAFNVRLERSGQLVEVPPGTSILDALRRNGHALPSSCESGTCGTCRTRYTAGEPDHRDLVLSDREKEREIMVCVSRARSPELTLDI